MCENGCIHDYLRKFRAYFKDALELEQGSAFDSEKPYASFNNFNIALYRRIIKRSRLFLA